MDYKRTANISDFLQLITYYFETINIIITDTLSEKVEYSANIHFIITIKFSIIQDLV